MSKFKIEIIGVGCDTIIFPISEEQLETLSDGNVLDGEMTSEEICEVLEIDDYYDSENMMNGLYFDNKNLSKSFTIIVKDEDDNEVWRMGDSFKFDYDSFEIEFLYNEEDYFMVESIQKGNFRVFELETEEFNPELLSPIVVEVLDGVLEIMTSLAYDGEELYGEFGDTTNKGDNYHLFEN